MKLVRDKNSTAWGHKLVLTSSWYELWKCQWCRSLSTPAQLELIVPPTAKQGIKCHICNPGSGLNMTVKHSMSSRFNRNHFLKGIHICWKKAGFLSFQPSIILLESWSFLGKPPWQGCISDSLYLVWHEIIVASQLWWGEREEVSSA